RPGRRSDARRTGLRRVPEWWNPASCPRTQRQVCERSLVVPVSARGRPTRRQESDVLVHTGGGLSRRGILGRVAGSLRNAEEPADLREASLQPADDEVVEAGEDGGEGLYQTSLGALIHDDARLEGEPRQKRSDGDGDLGPDQRGDEVGHLRGSSSGQKSGRGWARSPSRKASMRSRKEGPSSSLAAAARALR